MFPMTHDIAITVVVATRNREALLARLLDGLAKQFNAPPFEVIVGDNGSSDNTSGVVEKARDRLQIHYVLEKRPGKGRVINAALRFARGGLVVFTDDDTVPQHDWLFQLYAASQKYPDVDIFGGKIEVDLRCVPVWIQRSFNLMGLLTSAHNLGDIDTIYPYGQYPFGPNMAIRRHLLAGRKSPYPVNLGPGTDYPVGDETAFLMQFSPLDSQDRLFIPTAKVFHEVEEENLTLFGAIKRCYLSGKVHGRVFPPGASEKQQNRISTFSLILARIGTCRSFRELLCISVRYIGFLLRRFNGESKTI